MFNFFEQIKNDLRLDGSMFENFNLINMSNKLVYVEGHRGVFLISDDCISFKIKKGIVLVCGNNLVLKKITKTTLVIQGEIKKVESY